MSNKPLSIFEEEAETISLKFTVQPEVTSYHFRYDDRGSGKQDAIGTLRFSENAMKHICKNGKPKYIFIGKAPKSGAVLIRKARSGEASYLFKGFSMFSKGLAKALGREPLTFEEIAGQGEYLLGLIPKKVVQ